jgi:DNA polymerase-3 subunit epsilon
VDVSAGISLRPEDTLLTDRARDFLTAGPADVVRLIEHICQLPGAPRPVAEHLAAVLFAGRRDFARAEDGRWCLTEGPRRGAGEPGAMAAMFLPAATAHMVRETPGSAAVEDALHSLSYVVVDVETTGGRARAGDRITEVAAVVVRDGQIGEVFETLVNPQRPIPRWITRLTNISWDMVRDKPTFPEICDRLVDVLSGHVFVAHNATFDWNFISTEVERATGRRLEGRRLCTVRMARRLLPQLRRRSLDYVTQHYGIEIEARHRAGGDAVATAHVLLRLLRDARHRGIGCWTDLQRLMDGDTGRARRRRRRNPLPHPVSRDTTA